MFADKVTKKCHLLKNYVDKNFDKLANIGILTHFQTQKLTKLGNIVIIYQFQ